MVSRNGLTELLQRSRGGRVRRRIGMQHTVGRMSHDDKHVEETKGRRDDDAKVTRNDGMGVITHERPPALGRGAFPAAVILALGQILAHGVRRHAQPQLEQQFIGDAFLPPRRILTSHTTDECLQVCRDWWASSLRLPLSEQAEPLLPAETRRRLHNRQRLTPVEPAPKPH